MRSMQLVKAISHSALNLLFPPQCLACEARVSAHGALCSECWNAMTFLTEPLCTACGVPFEFGLGDEALCSECIRARPVFSQSRAAFRYDAASKKLIKSLKYHDNTMLAPILARWMLQAGSPLVAASDVIIPVPLHRTRFIQRRYNQAALLAQAMARITHQPCLQDGLIRTRKTPTQTGLSRKMRAANVEGAFGVNARHFTQLRSANVLLVDDVYTTGATLSACTLALHEAGVRQVRALTLARRV